MSIPVVNAIAQYACAKTEQIRRWYILKRAGFVNWETYTYYNDPDVFWQASRVSDFYHGYPYVHRFEDRNHKVYDWSIVNDGMFVIDQWCKKNIKGKYRFDGHRVLCEPSTGNEWEINDIGGSDYYYVAFKEERDYVWFLMKWS